MLTKGVDKIDLFFGHIHVLLISWLTWAAAADRQKKDNQIDNNPVQLQQKEVIS